MFNSANLTLNSDVDQGTNIFERANLQFKTFNLRSLLTLPPFELNQ